ncbi:hypothetical protein [Flavobacterium sp.]|jgi:hypothetical protein|uniref:hypothetical protein n=1 Tax=Flavobacterium sp. TaxID=239 RepID=UPI0037C16262
MNTIIFSLSNNFDTYFNSKNTRKIELIILRIAVFSFLLHLLLIFLGNNFLFFQHFQHSYLKAIYTPFSFILFYEVFLLIIIIPKSISEFIGKQFEVITLITLRSFFHDIAELDLKESFTIYNTDFISLIYDLCAAILMLSLTILYYKIYQNNGKSDTINQLNNFIQIKKMVSIGMILILLLLSVFSFYNWSYDMLLAIETGNNFPSSNAVFYSDFFSIMIFVDVLLLIISFTYHFSFFTIFRNASFIITTILIRMSLTIEKPMNYILILIGFLFSIFSFYLFGLRKKIGQ